MPVPDRQSRRHLFALLCLAILSGCMADAQPELPQVALFAPQPSQAAWNVAPSASVRPTQAEQTQAMRAIRREWPRDRDGHVPSPDSGTIIALP